VNLGFIGLGKMGEPMAMRLLDASFTLNVWNRSPAKTINANKAGAVVASCPSVVASRSEIIISMLNDDDAALEVFEGADGLLAGNVEDKLFIEMSTLRPSTARKLATSCNIQGAAFIDAPVSGTVGPAEEGRLMALVGGKEADLERARPVLDILTRRIVHVGAVGQGSLMKLVINLPLAVYWHSLGEAAAMGHAGGLELSVILDVMKDSGASMAAFPKKIPEILGESDLVTFDIDTLHKDVEFIIETGMDFHVPMAAAKTILSSSKAAKENGLGSADASELVRFIINSYRNSENKD
tara:strand:- start:1689 stop:2576 length:888 start_codon:yes stop_codon:yes gene_type:complete